MSEKCKCKIERDFVQIMEKPMICKICGNEIIELDTAGDSSRF